MATAVAVEVISCVADTRSEAVVRAVASDDCGFHAHRVMQGLAVVVDAPASAGTVAAGRQQVVPGNGCARDRKRACVVDAAAGAAACVVGNSGISQSSRARDIADSAPSESAITCDSAVADAESTPEVLDSAACV